MTGTAVGLPYMAAEERSFTMSEKIPNTPFSTRLSGSAKELELRLRSIFHWKKKRPPVVFFALAVVVALLCGGLIGFRSVPQDNAAGLVPAEPDDAAQTKTENESLEDAPPAEPTESYVVDMTTPDGTVYPAARHEEDGWHIDIPEGWSYNEAWNRWDLPDTDVYIQVQFCTGSVEYIKAYYAQIGAWRYDTDMEAPYDYYYLLNPLEVNSSGLHREAFFVPLTEDTCYTIFCTWVKDGKTAEEQELLHTVAASFTTDGAVPVEDAQAQLVRRASIDGLNHMPLEDLPQEVRSDLTLVSESEFSDIYDPEWGCIRTYTSSGLDVTTTAPSAAYLEYLRECGYEESIEGEEDREWVISATIRDDRYATLNGLTVGMTRAQAEALGYTLEEGTNSFGNGGEIALSVTVEGDTVTSMQVSWRMGRLIGKFFEL